MAQASQRSKRTIIFLPVVRFLRARGLLSLLWDRIIFNHIVALMIYVSTINNATDCRAVHHFNNFQPNVNLYINGFCPVLFVPSFVGKSDASVVFVVLGHFPLSIPLSFFVRKRFCMGTAR